MINEHVIFMESDEHRGLLLNSYIPLVKILEGYSKKCISAVKSLVDDPSKDLSWLKEDIRNLRSAGDKIELTPEPISPKSAYKTKTLVTQVKHKIDKLLEIYGKLRSKVKAGRNIIDGAIFKPKVYLNDERDPERYNIVNKNIRTVFFALDWFEKYLLDLYNLNSQDENILSIVDAVYYKQHIYESVDNETPEDLLKLMSNIEYGYVGKDGSIHTNIDDDYDKLYKLQSPDELRKSKTGLCLDQVELEREWFTNHNIPFATYYIEITDKDGDKPSHVFLVYKNENNEYCWFENSWANERGIHVNKNLKDLLKIIAQKHVALFKWDGKNPTIKKYSQPSYGISYNEFIDFINNKNMNESTNEGYLERSIILDIKRSKVAKEFLKPIRNVYDLQHSDLLIHQYLGKGPLCIPGTDIIMSDDIIKEALKELGEIKDDDPLLANLFENSMSFDDMFSLLLDFSNKYHVPICIPKTFDKNILEEYGGAIAIKIIPEGIDVLKDQYNIIGERYIDDNNKFILFNPLYFQKFSIAERNEIELILLHEYGHLLTIDKVKESNDQYIYKRNIIQTLSQITSLIRHFDSHLRADFEKAYYLLERERLANDAVGIDSKDLIKATTGEYPSDIQYISSKISSLVIPKNNIDLLNKENKTNKDLITQLENDIPIYNSLILDKKIQDLYNILTRKEIKNLDNKNINESTNEDEEYVPVYTLGQEYNPGFRRNDGSKKSPHEFTHQTAGYMIKAVTLGDSYTHALISFDDTFKHLWSYSKEGIVKDNVFTNPDWLSTKSVYVSVIFVTKEQRDRMEAECRKLYEDKESTQYAFSDILKNIVGISTHVDKRFVCSAFVGYIMALADQKYLHRDYGKFRPEDVTVLPRSFYVMNFKDKDDFIKKRKRMQQIVKNIYNKHIDEFKQDEVELPKLMIQNSSQNYNSADKIIDKLMGGFR